jgi:hypothetical protein
MGSPSTSRSTRSLKKHRRSATGFASYWASRYLKPNRTGLRDRFLQRLDDHVSRAEPGSLAALAERLVDVPE